VDLDRDALLKVFLAEAAEGLDSMERAALLLEKAPQDRELVQSLFRDAHTLKGNALSLGFPALASFAHHLEDRLDAVRAGAAHITPELITLLLGSVDALRELVAEAAPAEEPDAAHSLRVEVIKLDRMLALSGEMAIARSRVRQLLAANGDRDGCEELDRLSRELQEEILQVRAVPLGPTLEQHARTVRDAAAGPGKSARLVIEGGDVEVDTAVVELLRDPLTHLVRNAVAHGIESPARRAALGKPAAGTITLRARHDNGSVVLEVSDDGAGFDRERIAQKARTRGMQVSAADDDLFNVVFEAGFSTAERVTDLSGRGVGLDVVRHNLERLRGSVSIENRPGQGATVTLRLPLTLAIIDAFFVGAGGETYAIPLESMIECVDLPCDRNDTGGVINFRGEALPWIALARHFGVAAGTGARRSLVVVQHGRGRAGLAVERLDGEGETVLKPLTGLVQGVRGIAGSALLGDGRVALILDVPALLASAIEAARAA
jgi:two-component system chemotaxis sensor kinase CheA